MGSDRKELAGHVDGVLDALAEHDSSRLPLANGARYTENGQELRMVDGLWQTTSSIGDFRIDAADPAAGRAVYYGTVIENGIPGLLSLRLGVTGREIAEIEAVIVRTEKPGEAVGVNATTSSQTMYAPRPLHEFDLSLFTEPDPVWAETSTRPSLSREGMIAAVNAYFDGVEQDRSADVPLAETCVRKENGVQVVNNPGLPPVGGTTTPFHVFDLGCAEQLDSGFFGYISGVRRRHLIVDQEHELLFGVYLFDHPGDVTAVDVTGVGKVAVPASFHAPSTFLAPHLFKIRDGKLIRIEAAVKEGVPYRMKSGWD